MNKVKKWWNNMDDSEKGLLMVGVAAVGTAGLIALKIHQARHASSLEDAKDAVNFAAAGVIYREITDRPFNVMVTKVIDNKVCVIECTEGLAEDEVVPAMKEFIEKVPEKSIERVSYGWTKVNPL